jgi:Zn-dependent metalloprotease
VFGDGDGVVFADFTRSIDVIAHELTHGVTEFTCGLAYHNQSGALNESISDVFGSLVKQWTRHETADEADWLIGTEVLTPGIEADALRSMKAPGTAYNNDLLGHDPQPDNMEGFVELPDTDDGDNGGVHINSGIPNKAFYLAATRIGGYAWEAAGHIWFEALRASHEATEFQEFAETTVARAEMLYGSSSAVHNAMVEAWKEVGISVATNVASTGMEWSRMGRGGYIASGTPATIESLAALKKQVESLASQVKALTESNGSKVEP